MEVIKKENKMGTAPVAPLIIKMALPMMLSMLVQALYNIVDSIFVSQISENALTAVSLVYPFQFIVVALGVGTGVGVNSLAARRLGEKNQALADATATQGQFLALVSSVVFMAVSFFIAKPVLAGFTEDAEIAALGTTYMQICCGLCGFAIFQMMIEKTLQATGNMFHAMLIQLVGAVINIILDPILIFGQYGFPEMGVAGAAVATVFGQFVGMVLGFFLLFRKDTLIKVTLKRFRPDFSIIRDIYKVGLPSIVMNMVGSFTNLCMNSILLTFTPTAVSVWGVFGKLQSFVFMPVFGLNSGAMPVMAYNFGARNRKRVMQSLKYGCIYSVAILTLGMLVFLLLPETLLGFFNASEHMQSIGVPALRSISICFPLVGFSIMFSTLFQAVGHGFLSMFISCCRQIVIILPIAYFFSLTGNLELVWFAYPIAEVAACGISAIMLKTVYNKAVKPLDLPPCAPNAAAVSAAAQDA